MNLRHPLALLLISAGLSACVRPQETILPEGEPGAVYTAAAATASVYLPEGGFAPPRKTATSTPQSLSPNQSTPTTPDTVEGDQEEIPCDRVQFIEDVTIPDDYEISPGEEFTKIWRLKNTGTCSWTIGYSLVFEKGDSLGAPAVVQLTNQPVPPGETVDVSVDFQAPEEIGPYQGYWKIRNVKGDTFGLGDFSQPFWVKISVVQGGGMMFDFNARAGEAAWGSGKLPVRYAEIGESILYFDRQTADQNPLAAVKADQPLEGGRNSGLLLLTRPGVGSGEYIIGQFPGYTVSSSDLLFGRAGLIQKPNGNCGDGEVDFLLQAMVNQDPDSLETLWEGNQVCDGQLESFEIDLSDLEGEEVQFVLVVISRNQSADNYAVWDSLAVRR